MAFAKFSGRLDCQHFRRIGKISRDQIEATRTTQIDPAIWSPVEARLLEAVDNRCIAGCVGEALIAQVEDDWTVEQQLEIFALCGTYHTISFVANSARLANEPFGARFPSAG